MTVTTTGTGRGAPRTAQTPPHDAPRSFQLDPSTVLRVAGDHLVVARPTSSLPPGPETPGRGPLPTAAAVAGDIPAPSHSLSRSEGSL